MEKFWGTLGRLVDFLDTLALVVLATALAFSIGYQIGFTSGLDTKVTWVGEKYTMKATGNAKR
jgi:ABC-type proline/glycine betaine transport system permease subunit